MSYDGSTPLQPAIAELLGISAKSQSQIAEATREAKEALGIDVKKRRLPCDDRVKVYEYLKSRKSNKAKDKTDTNDATPATPEPEHSHEPEQQEPTVELITQAVEIKSQDGVGLISQPVGIVTQLLEVTLKNNLITSVTVKNSDVKTNSHDSKLNSQVDNFDDVRIAFYVTTNNERKRQVISLDGFFVNALASIGVLKNDLPQWVQAQVDGWSAFDSKLPITRQIKYLIMREVVKGLNGDDGCFYSLAE